RTGAPIVPMGMAGTEGAMPKGSKMVHPVKIVVVIRPPIYPPPRTDGGRVSRRAIRELTETLRQEIQLAFDEGELDLLAEGFGELADGSTRDAATVGAGRRVDRRSDDHDDLDRVHHLRALGHRPLGSGHAHRHDRCAGA